jgi:hypothetical protein
LFIYEMMQNLLLPCMESESNTLKFMAAQTTVILAYLIQDVPSLGKQSQFHRDSNLTLSFLGTFYETIGNFEIPLSLVALKVFARLHNN